jgi:hypothetical protein
MTPSRLLPAILVAAGLLAAAPAGAVTYPPAERPHTRVATYVRNGVSVTRLQARVKPAAGRLRVTVDARVHNDLHLVKGVTLRVGSCTGGNLGYPTCPDAVRIDVPVAAGRTVSVRRTVTVPVPRRAVDRVQVSFTKHGTLPRRGLGGTYGALLLNGHAWRASLAGRTFGVDLTPVNGTSVQRILVDAAAETGTQMRAPVAWTARSQDAVTLETGLAGRALHPDVALPAGGATKSFLDRSDISLTTRPSAFTALVRTAAGASLATVRLPWPA